MSIPDEFLEQEKEVKSSNRTLSNLQKKEKELQDDLIDVRHLIKLLKSNPKLADLVK